MEQEAQQIPVPSSARSLWKKIIFPILCAAVVTIFSLRFYNHHQAERIASQQTRHISKRLAEANGARNEHPFYNGSAALYNHRDSGRTWKKKQRNIQAVLYSVAGNLTEVDSSSEKHKKQEKLGRKVNKVRRDVTGSNRIEQKMSTSESIAQYNNALYARTNNFIKSDSPESRQKSFLERLWRYPSKVLSSTTPPINNENKDSHNQNVGESAYGSTQPPNGNSLVYESRTITTTIETTNRSYHNDTPRAFKSRLLKALEGSSPQKQETPFSSDAISRGDQGPQTKRPSQLLQKTGGQSVVKQGHHEAGRTGEQALQTKDPNPLQKLWDQSLHVKTIVKQDTQQEVSAVNARNVSPMATNDDTDFKGKVISHTHPPPRRPHESHPSQQMADKLENVAQKVPQPNNILSSKTQSQIKHLITAAPKVFTNVPTGFRINQSSVSKISTTLVREPAISVPLHQVGHPIRTATGTPHSKLPITKAANGLKHAPARPTGTLQEIWDQSLVGGLPQSKPNNDNEDHDRNPSENRVYLGETLSLQEIWDNSLMAAQTEQPIASNNNNGDSPTEMQIPQTHQNGNTKPTLLNRSLGSTPGAQSPHIDIPDISLSSEKLPPVSMRSKVLQFSYKPKIGRKYAVVPVAAMGTDYNYIFPIPMTVLSWQRIGFDCIVFLIGSEKHWVSNPILYYVLKELRRLDPVVLFIDAPQENWVFLSQVSRLFAGFLFDWRGMETTPLIMTDSDIWPLTKEMFDIPHDKKVISLNSECCGTFMHRGVRYKMLPMCNIVMSAITWQQVLLTQDTTKRPTSVIAIMDYFKNEFGDAIKNSVHKGENDGWFADQHMISIRIAQWDQGSGQVLYASRDVGRDRIDRSHWFPYGITRAHDIHILEKLYEPGTWHRVLPLTHQMYNETTNKRLEEYRDGFIRMILNYKVSDD